MNIPFFLISDNVESQVVDIYGVAAEGPIITRGLKATLKARILHNDADLTPFTAEELDYAGWYCALCHDWNTTTDPQILEVSEITVGTVSLTKDEESADYAEIQIELSEEDTNTAEVITALNNGESVTLGCEIGGIATGDTEPSFVSQFNMAVRGRRWIPGTGIPEAVPDGGYTAPQIDALFAAVYLPPVDIDFKVAQQNVIYTVPADFLFKPDIGKLLTKTLTGYASGMEYKWLADAVELMPGRPATMDAAYKFDDDVLDPDQYFPAGTEIILEVTTAGTSTTHSGTAQIEGDLIDA